MNPERCTTHHYACDCREDEFRRMAEENENLKREKKELEETMWWSSEYDKELPEDKEIAKAHPMASGRHDLFKEATRLVGAKHSKYALIELVNWLLHEKEGV